MKKSDIHDGFKAMVSLLSEKGEYLKDWERLVNSAENMIVLRKTRIDGLDHKSPAYIKELNSVFEDYLSPKYFVFYKRESETKNIYQLLKDMKLVRSYKTVEVDVSMLGNELSRTNIDDEKLDFYAIILGFAGYKDGLKFHFDLQAKEQVLKKQNGKDEDWVVSRADKVTSLSKTGESFVEYHAKSEDAENLVVPSKQMDWETMADELSESASGRSWRKTKHQAVEILLKAINSRPEDTSLVIKLGDLLDSIRFDESLHYPLANRDKTEEYFRLYLEQLKRKRGSSSENFAVGNIWFLLALEENDSVTKIEYCSYALSFCELIYQTEPGNTEARGLEHRVYGHLRYLKQGNKVKNDALDKLISFYEKRCNASPTANIYIRLGELILDKLSLTETHEDNKDLITKVFTYYQIAFKDYDENMSIESVSSLGKLILALAHKAKNLYYINAAIEWGDKSIGYYDSEPNLLCYLGHCWSIIARSKNSLSAAEKARFYFKMYWKSLYKPTLFSNVYWPRGEIIFITDVPGPYRNSINWKSWEDIKWIIRAYFQTSRFLYTLYKLISKLKKT